MTLPHADARIAGAATELLSQFGSDAASIAEDRARHSRTLGNAWHFCHWRQVGRLVALLASDRVVGSIH
jgi:hypothetical protein